MVIIFRKKFYGLIRSVFKALPQGVPVNDIGNRQHAKLFARGYMQAVDDIGARLDEKIRDNYYK